MRGRLHPERAAEAAGSGLRQAARRRLGALGGGGDARVIAILAGVLSLDAADKGAIGALASQLELAFGIGATRLGLLVSLSTAVSLLTTLPFGRLVDRHRRTRLLAATILVWGAAMLASGAVSTYPWLLAARLLLGAATAVTGPAIASLLGDYFSPRQRGRVYGFILSGELIGTGIGFLVAGELGLITWRAGFIGLAIPALGLAWLVDRLPEPPRGRGGDGEDGRLLSDGDSGRREAARTLGRRKVRAAHWAPRKELVLAEDPRGKSLWWAARYVLRIPTNVVLIVASALGYYFFSGARVFGLQFFEGQFHVGHSRALVVLMALGAGSLIGVVTGGRAGDRLLQRGQLSGRVIVATVAFLISASLLLAGLLANTLVITAPLLFCAAAALGAVNAPLDAARLDIMHHGLRGRAESVRMLLRRGAEAIAPLLFGYVADQVFGGGIAGLRATFLVMLIPLFLGGLIGIFTFRTYPRDVATADAYMRRTRGRS